MTGYQRLSVIVSEPKREEPDWFGIYSRMFIKAIKEAERDKPLTHLPCIYAGVKMLNKTFHGSDNVPAEVMEARLDVYQIVLDRMSLLTPRQLMRAFPIRKEYNGARWESKDYYTTIEALNSIGMDTPMREETQNLLWDYMNYDLITFHVGFLSALSAIMKLESGKGLMEKFSEMYDVPMYSMHTDQSTGKQYLVNSESGEMHRVSKPRPRHLKAIKGAKI